MATDNYATPESDLGMSNDSVTARSIWKPHGRLGVLAYWAHSLVLTLAFLLVLAALGALAAMLTGYGMEDFASIEEGGTPPMMFFLLLVPAFLIGMYVGICMMVKRLHDLNLKGWWGLIMLIPIIGTLFSLFIYFWPGKKTANRFGGWHIAAGWEKVLGILFILLMLLGIVASVALPLMSGAGLQ